MKLIILEGPDGAGKTTLAKQLEQQGYRYIHHGVPPAAEKDLFRWFMKPLEVWGGKPAVLDRLHLSDRIYGPVMRGGSPMTDLQERLVERYLNALGGQVVICLPPWRTVLSNWLPRREEEYVKRVADLRKIYEGYWRLLFSKRNRYYLWHDYTRWTTLGIVGQLLRAELQPMPPGVVGSPAARFLMVGERPNGKKNMPFLDWKNCSGYLNECLEEAGYEEHELAFANAYDTDENKAELREIYHKMKKPTVIALGAVAKRQLYQAQVPFDWLRHPQYQKRFHAKERDKYIEKLANIRRNSP